MWDLKNQNIELVAEAQHMHGVATTAQTAAAEAQQQVQLDATHHVNHHCSQLFATVCIMLLSCL